jgi:hypothetical protein
VPTRILPWEIRKKPKLTRMQNSTTRLQLKKCDLGEACLVPMEAMEEWVQQRTDTSFQEYRWAMRDFKARDQRVALVQENFSLACVRDDISTTGGFSQRAMRAREALEEMNC